MQDFYFYTFYFFILFYLFLFRASNWVMLDPNKQKKKKTRFGPQALLANPFYFSSFYFDI